MTKDKPGALQTRLDAYPESPSGLGPSDLEARLVSACTQLGEAFTDPSSLSYCEGYLKPVQSN